MRHSLCLLIGLAGMQASGATYTSVRNGVWSDAQTWGGMSVPGINDNVTVKHTVLLDVDTTVGTSPSGEKSPSAFAIRISKNAATNRGELIVASGVTLKALGDIRFESSSTGEFHALYQMNPGSLLIFDSSAASDPSAPHYRIYSADPANQGYRSSNVRILGAVDGRVRFRSITTGRSPTNGIANNHIFVEQRGGGLVDVVVRYADIEECGWQQGGCLSHAAEEGAQFVVEHVLMRRTSGIKPTYFAQNSPTPTSTFLLRDVKTFDTITTPVSSGYTYSQYKGSVHVSTVLPMSSGTRLIEECYFDQGMPYPGLMADFTVRHTVWDRHPPAANAGDGVYSYDKSAVLFENVVYRALNMDSRGLLARNVDGLYFFGDDRATNRGNPHGITVGIQGDVTVNKFIFDYGQRTSDPNGIWSQPYPTTGGPWTYQHTYTNMLLLPTSESLTSTTLSSPIGSMVLPRPHPRIRWEHNTYMYSGTRNFAQTNYLLEAGCPPAGSAESYRSNLAWGIPPSTNFAWTLHTGDPRCSVQDAAANIIDPSGISNNACYNCSLSEEMYWRPWISQHPGQTLTNIGTTYNIPTTGMTPGHLDLPSTADPQFVDIRRNLKTWCDYRLGFARGTCSADTAMNYLATGPGALRELITDLNAYVRAGYQPQNEMYRGAAHDGLDIGAVPMRRVGGEPPMPDVQRPTPPVVSFRIESNVAVSLLVVGPGCPSGTYTTPATMMWPAGVICTVMAGSHQDGPDSRWVFSHWSDGSVANPRSITSSASAVYALEHRLTRNVVGQGTVSGVDGFYAAASTVQLTATPAVGYQFSGWNGVVGGMGNPVTLRMDGPIIVTAHFTPVPGIAVEALQPMVGSGESATFMARFSHGGGTDQLYLGYLLFLPTPNVVNYVATGSCLVEYNRISNGMRLINDAGTGWLGPESGVVLSPSAGTLSNSRCTVNVAGASASLTGNTMSINAPITFKNAVSPVMGTFLQALDVTGKWTGMTQFGNWMVSTGSPRPGPSISGVTASSTVGSHAVYSITASHTSDASALAMIHLLISTGINGRSPCQAVYFPGSNALNLINDDGTAMVSPLGLVPGNKEALTNSRCSINTELASFSVTAKTVVITLPMNLQPSTFGGAKKVYVNVFDTTGHLTHWQQISTITVQ